MKLIVYFFINSYIPVSKHFHISLFVWIRETHCGNGAVLIPTISFEIFGIP